MKIRTARITSIMLFLAFIVLLFPCGANAEDDEYCHTDLVLNKNELELGPGCSEQLVPSFSWQVVSQEVLWASHDPSVASVDSSGNVTAHKIGTTTISCQLADGLYYDTCSVRVNFRDVPSSGEYYSKPVYWAYRKGITKGYTSGDHAGCFGVGLSCERKDLAIFLWRYAGCPTGYGDARGMFNDMAGYGPSTAANKAVAWTGSQGITKGYSDGGFHPTDPIVRKEILIILYRYMGKPEVDGTVPFTDCQDLDRNTDTYRSILWGSQVHITNGYSDGPYAGMFGVEVECLREQMITFLYRYHDYVTE